jgi:glucosamine--fructose-6-phosphate aminotransferase (isomerizing)
MADGYVFTSDTDTEVIAHLVHRESRRRAPDLVTAVRAACTRLTGAYAIGTSNRTTHLYEPNRNSLLMP